MEDDHVVSFSAAFKFSKDSGLTWLTIGATERFPPPAVKNFALNELSATQATLRWNASQSLYLFVYELSYKISDSLEWISVTLPDFERSATLRDLRPRSNYTAVLSTANQCLRTHGAPIHFVTAATDLHPAMTGIMGHEIFLIMLVLLIWAIIITHFFLMFGRVTMFSALSTPGLYMNRENESDRKNSLKSEHSQHSGKGSKALNVLEDAVSTWRSETVLSKVELLDGMEARRLVNAEPDRVSLDSETKEEQRKCVSQLGTSENHDGSMVRSHSDGGGPFSGRNSLGREVSFYLPERKKFPILENAELLKQKKEQEEEEERRRVEEARILKRKSFAVERAGSKRKISEVLLGKATSDIRRCSSPGNLNNIDRGVIRRRLQKRRRSLLQTLGLTRSFRAMRRKYRRRRMEAVREDSHEYSIPQPENNGVPQTMTIQANPLASRRDVPMEAYVTPHDIVINIDGLER
uniref:Fibronectin type-III domain-containing protein n=1 Tax=Steinernema glaseri TaxID=37863 RepID=A0A1I8AUN7_9BILA